MPLGLYLAELLKGMERGPGCTGGQFPCSLSKDNTPRLLPQPSAYSEELLAHSWGWSLPQTGQGQE